MMPVLDIFLPIAIILIAFGPKWCGRWWADFKIGFGSRMNE